MYLQQQQQKEYQYPQVFSPVMPAIAYPMTPYYYMVLPSPNIFSNQQIWFPTNQQQQNKNGNTIPLKPQSRNVWDDSLTIELNKFEGRRAQPKSNSHIFHPEPRYLNNKSINNVVTPQKTAEQEKKILYAQMLREQQQVKQDIWLEKKQLETKLDLAMRYERQQNGVPTFNRPSRDILRNELHTRNEQPADWFTHLPNIDVKYIPKENFKAFTQYQNQYQQQNRLTTGQRGQYQGGILSTQLSTQNLIKPTIYQMDQRQHEVIPSQSHSFVVKDEHIDRRRVNLRTQGTQTSNEDIRTNVEILPIKKAIQEEFETLGGDTRTLILRSSQDIQSSEIDERQKRQEEESGDDELKHKASWNGKLEKKGYERIKQPSRGGSAEEHISFSTPKQEVVREIPGEIEDRNVFYIPRLVKSKPKLEDNLNRSAKNIFSSQQARLDMRLKEMGISQGSKDLYR